MKDPMPDWAFKGMQAIFVVRDWILPPVRNIHEAGVRLGDVVLDFGCGPGSYTLAAADIVRPEGVVYALDLQPTALQTAKEKARARGLQRFVRTIHSPLVTGLPDEGVDVVLLYDVLHMLEEPARVLAELHRVLKPSGVLSVAIHHMKKQDGIALITGTGLFSVTKDQKRTVSFAKASRP